MTPTPRDILGLGSLTRAQIVAMGPAFAKHVADFVATIDVQLARDGDSWESNYYDRAAILRAWGILLDRPDLTTAAQKLTARYRDEYLVQGTSAHWALPDGVAVDALMGNAASRATFTEPPPDWTQMVDGRYPSAAGQFRQFGLKRYTLDRMANRSAGTDVENRMIARAIHAQLITVVTFPTPLSADEQADLRASARGIDVTDRASVLRWTITQAIAQQAPDGSFPKANQCDGDSPFMDAMLSDVLSRSHELFEPRVDVRDAVVRNCRYLMTQWDETGMGFRYRSVLCDGNGTGATADITLLHLAPFYFAARFAPELLAFADHAFAVGVANTALLPSKQWNQSHHSTFRALAWRAMAVATKPALTDAQRLAGITAIDYVRRPSGKESKATKAALAPIADYLRATSP